MNNQYKDKGSLLYNAHYELLVSIGAQVWHVLTRDLTPTRLSTSGMNHTCL